MRRVRPARPRAARSTPRISSSRCLTCRAAAPRTAPRRRRPRWLWTLGPSLGSGGFGEVYVAESRGQWAAIKLVPKDPGARRELLFADDLRRATNVLPVEGVGETKSHWALLMPMAEQTLRQYLVE